MLWILILALWIFVFWVANAIFCGILAGAKKQSVPKWVVLGVVFPIISLITIAGLPGKTESTEIKQEFKPTE